MTPNEALTTLVKNSTLTQADLARATNVSAQAFNHRVLKTENPHILTIIEILDVMGYQVVFTHKGAKLPSNSIILTKN